jgi:hypothetical protein
MNFTIAFLFSALLIVCHNGWAQPSKSYKKQMKAKDKAQGKATDFDNLQKESAGKLLKYDKKLTALDKELKDAQASGNLEDVDKVDTKIREVKGKKHFEKDKIENKIAKEYQKSQDKEVRKRMKKNRKKSNRINDNKREPFFKRLF